MNQPSVQQSSKFQSGLTEMLFNLILFGVLMVIVRVIYTAQFRFVFLLWNLFLALVPMLLTRLMFSGRILLSGRPMFCLLFVCWLLFIPNSFYLITDLIHLKSDSKLPQWYDLLLLFSFAITGFIIGLMSIRRMETLFRIVFPLVTPYLFIVPVLFLSALGVYMGRFLRYNSWDVFLGAPELLTDMYSFISNPLGHESAWGMVTSFFVFLLLVYHSFSRIETNKI